MLLVAQFVGGDVARYWLSIWLEIERLRSLGLTPDAVARRYVLGKDTFMLFPILEPSSLPVVVAQPDKRFANKTAFVLEWYE